MNFLKLNVDSLKQNETESSMYVCVFPFQDFI